MKIINIADYICFDDKFYDENKVYKWNINDVIYEGKVKDFIETMGETHIKYGFYCKACKQYGYKGGVSIIKNGLFCSNCGKSVTNNFNESLRGLYPEIADMYDKGDNAIDSHYLSVNSTKKYYFRCNKGHLFSRSLYDLINSIAKGRKVCSVCSGHTVLTGYNDLQTYLPEVVDYWDYEKNIVTPDKVSKGSEKKYWFKCKEGHSYLASPCSIRRTIRDGYSSFGCPYCGGSKLKIGFNDLESQLPKVANLWDNDKNGKSAKDIFKGAKGKYWFKCSKGHSYENTIEHVKRAVNSNSGSEGCPYCSGHIPEKGKSLAELNNSLVSSYWDFEANAGVISPYEVSNYSNKQAFWKCVNCGETYSQQIDSRCRCKGLCPNCYDRLHGSYVEVELFNFINSKVNAERCYILPSGKEIDIFIPSLNIGFEFNGVYWHSEKVNPDRYSHYAKFKEAKSLGITLYCVWEDDYKSKKDLVEKWVLNKIGCSDERKVNARDCVILNGLNAANVKDFFSEYHIQGFIGASKYIGLQDKSNNLVACLAYTEDKNGFVYIKRYCTSCNVRGGFSKLLKYFERNGYKGVYTFSDNAVSTGLLYKNNGFVLDCELKPDYMYLVGTKREHKFNYRIERFKKDTTLKYKEGMSEKELADLNGLYRIWDYGKLKWVKTFKQRG